MSSTPAPGPAPAPTPAPGPAPAPSKTSATTTTKKVKPAKASGAGTQAKPKKPSRRKKPAPKASSAASTQAIRNDGRAATTDLALQRAQAAARRSDPLWYRIEDVLPAAQEGTAMSSKKGILPEQTQLVDTALLHSGLTRADVTPQALACLLEQARRYAQELIADAQDYAVNRTELSRADLQLAADMRADYPVAISTQLPKLNLVAQQVNRAPLPPIPSHCYSGILLPPKEHQLTARTFDIVTGAQVAQKMVQKAPEPPKKRQSSTTPSYGASRGRQIPIKLKEQPSQSQTSIGPTPMDTSADGGGAAPVPAPSAPVPASALPAAPMPAPQGQVMPSAPAHASSQPPSGTGGVATQPSSGQQT